MASDDSAGVRRFGTFEGVFTPTLLTILGVIMYLREGWVVGQVGLLGAWLVILAASTITVCTALSVSSIATNVQLGEGGPYAIVTRSLGLELGGSIGIPLYLSQALAVAMYVFGLREGWCWIFPHHPEWAVDGVVFVLVVGLTLISTSLAFRVQYVVLAIILVSLVAIAGGVFGPIEPHAIEWWRTSGGSIWESSGFWVVFAIYFPATTGILAGANMSGELRQPRRSIPLGTLSATGIATVIYLLLAWWLASVASGDELRASFMVMIDRSIFPPLVVAGLLAASFSSALGSFVGAPRILHALGEGGVVPFGRWIAGGRSKLEPRRAAIVTGVVVLFGLSLRDLNVIAPLITLFFLITYGMINAVVLLEQRLAVVSFRPRLRLPWIVPLVGALGALFAMFVVNAVFSFVALGMVVGVYVLLMRRRLEAPTDDVRSGLFLMIAEWAARRASRYSKRQARAWKANLLVPVFHVDHVRESFGLIVDLAKPYGSITLIGVRTEGSPEGSHELLDVLANDFLDAGVHTTATELEVEKASRGVVHAMQTLRNAFLRPNILFVAAPTDPSLATEVEVILRAARRNRMGVVLAAQHPRVGLGKRKRLHVWIRPQGPDWKLEEGAHVSNLNLQLIVSYLLWQRWEGRITFHCSVEEGEIDPARAYIAQILELARIPSDSRVEVEVAPLRDAVVTTSDADVQIFGLPPRGELQFAQEMLELADATCLFVLDSGEEDALV